MSRDNRAPCFVRLSEADELEEYIRATCRQEAADAIVADHLALARRMYDAEYDLDDGISPHGDKPYWTKVIRQVERTARKNFRHAMKGQRYRETTSREVWAADGYKVDAGHSQIVTTYRLLG